MRRFTGILFAITLGWAVLTGVSTAAADTTVSLTFDDGNADQMPAVQMLTDHGMHGTFYIIPGRVDRPNSQYMTWANVQTIYAAGNEIGGHTQNHLHLPDLSASQQQSEICGGRDSLLAKGYPQISFAYPFGDHDSTSEQLVQQCGYLSGRGVGGLRDTGEPDADTIPPRNPWVLPTPGSIDIDDTLPNIKQWIMDAEAAGASGHSWINLVIHHLCDPDVTDCSDPSGVDDAYITPQDFDSLLDWLQPRALTGTHVKTVEEVMTGSAPQDTTAPVSSIKCNGASCSSGFYNAAVSATLSATDNTGGSGLKEIRYTTDGSNPTSSSPVYSAAIPVNSTTTIKWRAEDNAGNVESPVHSQLISIDTAKPTSSIQCNGAACASTFYNASVSATLSGNDTGGSGLKNIRYTTNGSDPTGSSTVYSGAIPVSSTTTIKWRAEDNAGNIESIQFTDSIQVDTVKPTSVIQCDAATCASAYNHSVSATLSGSDTGGSGVSRTFADHPRHGSDRLQHELLLRGDPGELDDHDQVARRRQRRQRGGDPHAGDHDRNGQPDQLDPVQRRRLRLQLLQRVRLGNALRLGHRWLGREEHPLHDRRLEPDLVQPGLLRRDPGQLDDHDQVASRGQRRQRRVAGALAADLDRHREADQLDRMRWGCVRAELRPPR